jgi:hypothetical protein
MQSSSQNRFENLHESVRFLPKRMLHGPQTHLSWFALMQPGGPKVCVLPLSRVPHGPLPSQRHLQPGSQGLIR